MNLLNPTNVWQANNLPNGINFSDGVISGTPTTAGTFTVPVTVTNDLGSSTKNITIITRNRPGTEKFSILQNGVQVAQLTIPELRAMVQDGTAQNTFNCTNTQIILPLYTPALTANGSTRAATTDEIAVNFCDFRNVTLEDGSIKQGLILQFDCTLWPFFAPFDTGDGSASIPINRWYYSNLRQWLNSSGANWFSPAYTGDTLTPNSNGYSSYADSGIHGFLDFLHEDLASALTPIKIQTQAYYDAEDETFTAEPDYINGHDVDVTYDKVFVPSPEEMYMYVPYSSYADNPFSGLPTRGIEGSAWAYWIAKFGTAEPIHPVYEGGMSSIYGTALITNWGKSLADVSGFGLSYSTDQNIGFRSAKNDSINKIWYSYIETAFDLNDLAIDQSYALSLRFAPAFVLC